MVQANRLLGYPADARLLILNADDLGMCHAVNEATLRTLRDGVVSSTSLMVPCPWALHAMHILTENPDFPFGIHLTVICDTVHYKWGPLTAREKIPSLVNEAGYFFSDEQIAELMKQARVDELEVEFRAQIEAVLAAGLCPTHLDWHCLHDGGRPDIFDMTRGLAQEYGLALRVSNPILRDALQIQGLPTADHGLLDSYDLSTVDKVAGCVQLLRDLPAGLSEWAVHPGFGNSELQTIEPGWEVRQTDFDFLMSQPIRDAIRQEGITVLSYEPLQQLWQSE